LIDLIKSTSQKNYFYIARAYKVGELFEVNYDSGVGKNIDHKEKLKLRLTVSLYSLVGRALA
jgi:hypothetical protein